MKSYFRCTSSFLRLHCLVPSCSNCLKNCLNCQAISWLYSIKTSSSSSSFLFLNETFYSWTGPWIAMLYYMYETRLTVRLIKHGKRAKLVLCSWPDSPLPQSKLAAQDLNTKNSKKKQCQCIEVCNSPRDHCSANISCLVFINR